MRRLVGGEWGGWCCAFDAHSGAVRAIPDKFVSETEIAYGQVPFGFEELQTESFEQIPYLDGSERASSDVPAGGGSDQLRRRRVQTHPPFGCGGDSLPGTSARRLLPTPRSGSLELRASTASAVEVLAAPAWALDAPVPGRPGVVRLETVLRGNPNPNPNPNPNSNPNPNPNQVTAVCFPARTSTPSPLSASARVSQSSSPRRVASWPPSCPIRPCRT